MRCTALSIALALLAACGPHRSASSLRGGRMTLVVMSLVDENNGDFENNVLTEFGRKRGYLVRYIPDFAADNRYLAIYRQLFREQSPQPDICEIDVIWPALLADHLVDLTPYLKDDLKAFPPELLRNFTVKGRLVAIPTYLDSGLLFYRSDLLRKYGFRDPPATWPQLEKMARVIQDGERRSGKRDFWGFVWQGKAYEGLTCDALEWQSSEGGGHIIEPDGTISVATPGAVSALERAASWIGTISPPGVIAYDEADSLNVWRSGNAAFMRNWFYVYGAVSGPSSPMYGRFGVALVPGGVGGRTRVLGPISAAVSRYSNHRKEAVEAVRHLTSMATQAARAVQIGSVPSRSLLLERADLMAHTPLPGPVARTVMTGLVARPSVVAGESYDAVSRAYFTAVHAALTREVTPREAMTRLEVQLRRIMRAPRANFSIAQRSN